MDVPYFCDKLIDLVGAGIALFGAYKLALHQERNKEKREHEARLATVKASLGLGLAGNLIALRKMVEVFAAYGRPAGTLLCRDHFQLDHAVVHGAIGEPLHEAFMVCAAQVEVINFRNSQYMDIEFRLRDRWSDRQRTALLHGSDVNQYVSDEMRPYLAEFIGYSQHTDKAISELLRKIAPDRLAEVEALRAS